jgi:hypothetical protein
MFGQTWRRDRSVTLRSLLLSVVVLLVIAMMMSGISGGGGVVGITPALAATVTRNPTVVDHLGDTIPLTMYMRLQRQTQKSFLFDLGATAGEAELEEGVVVEDAEGNVVVNPEDNNAARTTLLPDEWKLQQRQDLELPELGATTAKHKSQIVRNLPPAYGPRFGISRAVTLVANATLQAAGESLETDPARQQSDLAVRFSVGRGLQKESTWLPLATRHKVVNLLTELLAKRLDALREGGEAPLDAAARAEQVKVDKELEELRAKRDSPAVHYLSRVTFYFGYQTGEQQRLTSFAIDAHYSPVRRAGIELHYIWDEHRPYNPNRALVLCSAASLMVAMMMVVVVFHPSSRSMLLFSQRIVAVREHE